MARAGPWRSLLALMLVVLLMAGSFVAWALRSESGTAWLLSLVPGVRVTAPQGTLLGSFAAQRAEIALPRGGAVSIDGLRWQGLALRRTRWPVTVGVERLDAARVEVRPGTSDGTPLVLPESLALPVGVQVDALAVQTLVVTPLASTPIHGLRAAVQLGADAATPHRVDGLVLELAGLRAEGSARLAPAAPHDTQATLALQPAAAASAPLPWQARLQAAGPLQALPVTATLRAQPAGAPAQSLDLSAELRPLAAWPLGALQARAQGLDLSAFDARLPRTALSGHAELASEALDRPARLQVELDNPAAGRWNEARLPLHRLALALGARPDDPATLELKTLDAQLGSPAQPGGRVQAQGRWAREGWTLAATLEALQPARLDARAAALPFSGPLTLRGTPPSAATQRIEAQADLTGQVPQRQGRAAVALTLAGAWEHDAAGDRVELREAQARAGAARATLQGRLSRSAPDAPWQAQGHARLERFDPLPWWPGREDSPWRRGPHRIDASAEFDLAVPATVRGSALDRLLALRGQASLQLDDSLLAGVPLRGQARWRHEDGRAATLSASLDAGANKAALDGQLAARGADDRWTLKLDAPALAAFAPVWALLRAGDGPGALAGSLVADASIEGRWPAVASRGEASASALQVDGLALRRGSARWQAALAVDAPLQARLELAGLRQGRAGLDDATLELQGSGRAHRLELQARLPLRPPAWVDALQPARAAAGNGSVIRLRAEGGLLERDGAPDGWRGRIEQIEWLGNGAGEPAWLRSEGVTLEALGLAQAPWRVRLQPGRAELPGAQLRWERIAWQDSEGSAPATLDARATLDPVAVAPLLARLQPDFGWGGDLRVGATLDIASAPGVRADIVLQRERGDLTVTDETGTQALGLSELRLGLNVADGTWSFTQGLAGSTLGVAAGAFVARTSPQALWPAPDTPVSGVLELQVAQLGTWGPWVPPGWRLGGALRVSAGIGGTFGGPEYTGRLEGHQLSVRNFVQGVNVSDGEVAVALQGATARIERFRASAGAGTLEIGGEASLGAAPQARMTLAARQFQLLGRVDRRIVVSGDGQARLERDKLQLDGRFNVDEGLVDFTRGDAPTLGDDVVVQRGNGSEAKAPAPAAPATAAVRMPSVALDLHVNLGERLRVRGRGLDTRLAGELHVGAPGGKLAVDGTVRAVEGLYAAYGQKLEIDKGELVFNGPVENPRLDIEATRPNLDVRVGVAVTGNAANPRVRLFSEPEMSEMDKLSWLVLGRASDGLGRTDTALLQRAAMALLAGEGQGPSDPLLQALGLDNLSVRQTDGEVRETVVSLGKQLSRRWYVGYERGLNATAGSWQLIYRIAQRFTLRAQSGEDSSLDLIWTWRWN